MHASSKDVVAIKTGGGSFSSPSVGHSTARKSIGEAVKNAKKTSPTPLTPGSPIIKRGSRGARRSGSQASDFNFSETQVGTQHINMSSEYVESNYELSIDRFKLWRRSTKG